MKDIAKEVKVSVQTVSNVINKRDLQISGETRSKILKLVEKYRFKPSRIARNLRRGNTKTVGLIVPDMIYHPFYPKIFDIIENELRDYGFRILLFNTREDINREKESVDEFLENKVDGIILIRIVQKNPYLKKLPKDVPIIACLRAPEYINIPNVLCDNKKVGTLATEYLINNGHRKIVHITGNEDLLAHKERKIGYIKTLEENKIRINNEYIFNCDYKEKNLYDKLYQNLKEIKNYTAVFAYNDIVAINCIKAFTNLGIRVPEEVSVIGVDDMEIGNFITPSLTTIKQPIKKMCLSSIKLLISFIEKEKNYKNYLDESIIFDPELIARGSVKKI